jgi:hypothetical protein
MLIIVKFYYFEGNSKSVGKKKKKKGQITTKPTRSTKISTGNIFNVPDQTS